MSTKRIAGYIAAVALALAVAGGGLYGAGASTDDSTQSSHGRPMESLSLNL